MPNEPPHARHSHNASTAFLPCPALYIMIIVVLGQPPGGQSSSLIKVPDTEPRSAQLSPGSAYRQPLVTCHRLVSHSSAKQAQVQFPRYAAANGGGLAHPIPPPAPSYISVRSGLPGALNAPMALSFVVLHCTIENHRLSKCNAQALPVKGCRDRPVCCIIADGCPLTAWCSKRSKIDSPIAESGSSTHNTNMPRRISRRRPMPDFSPVDLALERFAFYYELEIETGGDKTGMESHLPLNHSG